MTIKQNLKVLEAFKFTVQKNKQTKLDHVIDLYRSRKINIYSARNLAEAFQSKHKATIKKMREI
jgi:hypothetical protein